MASSFIRGMFMSEDWRRVFAWTVVYGYAYNVIWPWIFWASTIFTLVLDKQIPAPPIVPWEQLLAATANLAVIGTVQIFRDKQKGEVSPE